MAAEAVLTFLDQQNRPYSTLDIQNGIKGGDFTKGAIQKALDALVEKGDVKEKVYGKQKVYFIEQNTSLSSKEVTEEILALDRQINELTSKVKDNSDRIKAKAGQYDQSKGQLTLPEACQKKVEMESEAKQLKNALKEFEGVDFVTNEVKDKVQGEYGKYLSEYRKRKRLCQDMLDAILENYPKTKQHLYEEIGIETDVDAGFNV